MVISFNYYVDDPLLCQKTLSPDSSPDSSLCCGVIPLSRISCVLARVSKGVAHAVRRCSMVYTSRQRSRYYETYQIWLK